MLRVLELLMRENRSMSTQILSCTAATVLQKVGIRSLHNRRASSAVRSRAAVVPQACLQTPAKQIQLRMRPGQSSSESQRHLQLLSTGEADSC